MGTRAVDLKRDRTQFAERGRPLRMAPGSRTWVVAETTLPPGYGWPRCVVRARSFVLQRIRRVTVFDHRVVSVAPIDGWA